VPALLLTEVGLPAGLDSLRAPRLRHVLGEVEPIDDDVESDVKERMQRQLAATLRNSLTVARANRFALAAFEIHGAQVSSAALPVNDGDLADVIACLLHSSSRDARFQVEVPRDIHSPDSDARTEDTVLAGTRKLERFTLARK
jgi:hypothetical protein